MYEQYQKPVNNVKIKTMILWGASNIAAIKNPVYLKKLVKHKLMERILEDG